MVSSVVNTQWLTPVVRIFASFNFVRRIWNFIWIAREWVCVCMGVSSLKIDVNNYFMLETFPLCCCCRRCFRFDSDTHFTLQKNVFVFSVLFGGHSFQCQFDTSFEFHFWVVFVSFIRVRYCIWWTILNGINSSNSIALCDLINIKWV